MFQKTSIEGVSSVKPARNKIESDYSICSHLKRLIPVCGFIQLSCMMSFICKKQCFFIKFPYCYAIFTVMHMDFVQTVFMTQIYLHTPGPPPFARSFILVISPSHLPKKVFYSSHLSEIYMYGIFQKRTTCMRYQMDNSRRRWSK